MLTRIHRVYDNKYKPGCVGRVIERDCTLQAYFYVTVRARHFSIGAEKQRGATLFYNRVETRIERACEGGRDGKVSE